MTMISIGLTTALREFLIYKTNVNFKILSVVTLITSVTIQRLG